MPQFSTPESVSLEKNVEIKGNLIQVVNDKEFDDLYEIEKCINWITTNNFQKVCLQFPDYLLPHSSNIAFKLQNLLQQTVYILGDTAYESCCIDFIAAAHINADAIIHFGPICFSKSSANIPYLNIYEKHPIKIADLKIAVCNSFNDQIQDLVILLDDPYIHCYDDVSKLFPKVLKIEEDLSNLSENPVLFVGHNQRKLININLSFKIKSLYSFNPSAEEEVQLKIKPFELDSKIIKRRYYLIEKIKDASTIGIVIGTLGVKNYLKIIERIKKLCDLCGKKYYLISVGKPTAAKLANIAEIDVYVMITCAMNEIYDSREFYKPIVTPYDVELALNNAAEDLKFSYDYNNYLTTLGDLNNFNTNIAETDISLITGKLRNNKKESTIIVEDDSQYNNESQIALKPDQKLALNRNFGAGFLNERTWKGLEQNLGQTEVKLAEKGRKGLADGYDNETF